MTYIEPTPPGAPAETPQPPRNPEPEVTPAQTPTEVPQTDPGGGGPGDSRPHDGG